MIHGILSLRLIFSASLHFSDRPGYFAHPAPLARIPSGPASIPPHGLPTAFVLFPGKVHCSCRRVYKQDCIFLLPEECRDRNTQGRDKTLSCHLERLVCVFPSQNKYGKLPVPHRVRHLRLLLPVG